jgi:hypothetical protein
LLRRRPSTAPRAVKAFQEREADRAQRLADRVAEAARVLLPLAASTR